MLAQKAQVVISDNQLMLYQEYNRAKRDLEWARGENRINLVFYRESLKAQLIAAGMEEYLED